MAHLTAALPTTVLSDNPALSNLLLPSSAAPTRGFLFDENREIVELAWFLGQDVFEKEVRVLEQLFRRERRNAENLAEERSREAQTQTEPTTADEAKEQSTEQKEDKAEVHKDTEIMMADFVRISDERPSRDTPSSLAEASATAADEPLVYAMAEAEHLLLHLLNIAQSIHVSSSAQRCTHYHTGCTGNFALRSVTIAFASFGILQRQFLHTSKPKRSEAWRLHEAVRRKDPVAVEKLLAMPITKKQALNEIDYLGRAPLHIACFLGSFAIVQSLLRAGASIHVLDKSGWSPLTYAVYWRHAALIKLLAYYGALDGQHSKTPGWIESMISRRIKELRTHREDKAVTRAQTAVAGQRAATATTSNVTDPAVVIDIAIPSEVASSSSSAASASSTTTIAAPAPPTAAAPPAPSLLNVVPNPDWPVPNPLAPGPGGPPIEVLQHLTAASAAAEEYDEIASTRGGAIDPSDLLKVEAAKYTWLMGLHTRAGQDSPIQLHFSASPLFDRHLLREVFSFVDPFTFEYCLGQSVEERNVRETLCKCGNTSCTCRSSWSVARSDDKKGPAGETMLWSPSKKKPPNNPAAESEARPKTGALADALLLSSSSAIMQAADLSDKNTPFSISWDSPSDSHPLQDAPNAPSLSSTHSLVIDEPTSESDEPVVAPLSTDTDITFLLSLTALYTPRSLSLPTRLLPFVPSSYLPAPTPAEGLEEMLKPSMPEGAEGAEDIGIGTKVIDEVNPALQSDEMELLRRLKRVRTREGKATGSPLKSQRSTSSRIILSPSPAPAVITSPSKSSSLRGEISNLLAPFKTPSPRKGASPSSSPVAVLPMPGESNATSDGVVPPHEPKAADSLCSVDLSSVGKAISDEAPPAPVSYEDLLSELQEKTSALNRISALVEERPDTAAAPPQTETFAEVLRFESEDSEDEYTRPTGSRPTTSSSMGAASSSSSLPTSRLSDNLTHSTATSSSSAARYGRRAAPTVETSKAADRRMQAQQLDRQARQIDADSALVPPTSARRAIANARIINSPTARWFQ